MLRRSLRIALALGLSASPAVAGWGRSGFETSKDYLLGQGNSAQPEQGRTQAGQPPVQPQTTEQPGQSASQSRPAQETGPADKPAAPPAQPPK
jgi:hypothetical protein